MSEQISSLRQQMRQAIQQPVAPMQKKQADPARHGFISRLLRRELPFIRAYERFPCCVVAVLTLTDKEVPIDGLVVELSQGGLLFRPASSFVFDRCGADIEASFGDDIISGCVVNVKSAGYGVRFHEPIKIERVQAILAQFGLGAGMAH